MGLNNSTSQISLANKNRAALVLNSRGSGIFDGIPTARYLNLSAQAERLNTSGQLCLFMPPRFTIFEFLEILEHFENAF